MGRGIIMIDNGGEGMDNVRPISDLRNNLQEVLRQAREGGEPITLTNGEQSMDDIIIVSRENLDKLLFEAQLIEEADKAEEEFERTGECYTLDELRDFLEKNRNEKIRNRHS